MSRVAGLAGVAMLGLAWGVTGRVLPHHPFTAHMTAHITVVALAAPLIAWALAGTRLDPVRVGPAVLFAPIPASMLELVAVWGWHVPALHTAARTSTLAYLGEQATFLVAGLVLWIAVLGGEMPASRPRRMAGVGALLFTSIHMTLLGALFALTPRPLYLQHEGMPAQGLFDLHLGGAVMLVVGGASYTLAALGLLAALVSDWRRTHTATHP